MPRVFGLAAVDQVPEIGGVDQVQSRSGMRFGGVVGCLVLDIPQDLIL